MRGSIIQGFKRGLGRLRRRGRGRWRLRPGLSVKAFLDALRERRVVHVVLRWFEHLPAIEDGEDIDLLIADGELARIEDLLTREKHETTIPCDLYSVSGLPRTDYRGLPYYPPGLAEGMLRRAVEHPSGARVPCARDHFFSLAYHVVYHKGPVARLEQGGGEHDYAGVLKRLGAEAGVAFEPTLAGLDACLAAAGWRPPLDTLAKLGGGDRANPFCGELAARLLAEAPDWAGFAVFVVREAGADEATLGWLREQIEIDGFEICAAVRLEGEARRRAHAEIRGGNWSQGPWSLSAGGPAVLLLAFDVFPVPADEETRRIHPDTDNLRVHGTKQRLRKAHNKNAPAGRDCNLLHASDSAAHAWHYAKEVCPEELARVAPQIERLHAWAGRHRTEGGERLLTRFGRRARVELVLRPDGTRVVRKTFRPQSLRFFRRELDALESLRANDPFRMIPPVVARGDDWLEIPFYEDEMTKSHWGPWLPWATVRDVFRAMEGFYAQGFVMLDFNPHNLLVDKRGDAKLIDFEFTLRLPEGAVRPPFSRSMTVVGPPADYAGDIPFGEGEGAGGHGRHWFSASALHPREIIEDSALLNRVRQTFRGSLMRLRGALRALERTMRRKRKKRR